jgi:CheY-like chemotaxis protein
MTTARIIDAIASLLWPLLVAVLLVRVLPLLPGLVGELRRAVRTRAFTVRVGGAELTFEEATEQLRRQVTDLQTHLAAQLAEHGGPGAAPPAAPGPPAPPGAPGGAPDAAAPAPDRGRPTILWVDDRPDERTLELTKLRDDGVEVLLARSTGEAMDVLSLRRGVRAVVTGLARTEDGEFRAHAGLALLRQLKEAEQDQPVLVYTDAARATLERGDALEAGASVVTASPVDLFAALRRVLSGPSNDPDPIAAAPGRLRRRPSRPG